ncbi:hypothetical protein [Roseisolibacter sp. H3M3-2]|uniref:hypothetical protein n=1 Tax=Roseisolibacter sp. H3M3-2 TaxID=3031323 RepID=UPI0023DA82B5|nr:hypothetical protein [Roseisolibacter sp. H3M3-2]MDF1502036.1 hypothetical protein [Roseisolibacter sp. H3M3-2]
MTRSSRLRLLLLFPALAACAGRAPVRTEEASSGEVELRDDEILVRVTNTYQGILDVYAIGSGLVDRLGTVSVGTPGTFRVRLRQFSAAAPIRIVARAIGGGGSANSGPLNLTGGEVVDLTVNANLSAGVLIR